MWVCEPELVVFVPESVPVPELVPVSGVDADDREARDEDEDEGEEGENEGQMGERARRNVFGLDARTKESQ